MGTRECGGHIKPLGRDRAAIWQIDHVTVDGFVNCYRFTTEVPAWFTSEPQFGRLDSNRERQVYVHTLNEGRFQLWQPTPLADGYIALTNRATQFVLDGNNEDIYTHDVNFGDFQHWGFFPA